MGVHLSALQRFVDDFQLVPAWCTHQQVKTVFHATNASEAYVHTFTACRLCARFVLGVVSPPSPQFGWPVRQPGCGRVHRVPGSNRCPPREAVRFGRSLVQLGFLCESWKCLLRGEIIERSCIWMSQGHNVRPTEGGGGAGVLHTYEPVRGLARHFLHPEREERIGMIVTEMNPW